MSIELIAVLVVIVAIVAISDKKKKKPDKQTGQKPQDNPEPVEPAPAIPDNAKKIEEKPPEKIPVIVVRDGHKQKGVLEMQKQGLRIYDASGNIMLDATTRLTKYIGTLSIGTSDGSYIDDRLQEGEFWYMTLKLNDYKKCYGMTNKFTEFLPKITREGNTIKWTYTNNDTTYRTGLTIMYGVY